MGGVGGIRTLGTLLRGTLTFQASTFDHSVTTPLAAKLRNSSELSNIILERKGFFKLLNQRNDQRKNEGQKGSNRLLFRRCRYALLGFPVLLIYLPQHLLWRYHQAW